MALRWVDGFDHYNTTSEKYQQNYGNAPSIGAGGRFGGNALTLTANSGGRGVKRFLDAQATWIVGFALKVGSAGFQACVISMIFDGATLHDDLLVGSDGLLSVRRAGTTTLGTGTTVLSPDIWYFIEWKVTISDTVGVVVVRVNGVTDLNLSNQDTRNAGNSTANAVVLCNNVGSGSTPLNYIDDVYICDGTGGAPTNDFLGDCRVETLLPNGNGNSSMFDGSDGNQIDNYLLVDEADDDADTTYVESADVNDKDTYTYGDLASTSGTVYGVAPVPRFRKTTSGSRTAVSVARLSGTEVDSAGKVVYDSFTYNQDIRETKPGGGAWTISDVNSAEFGMKVTV